MIKSLLLSSLFLLSFFGLTQNDEGFFEFNIEVKAMDTSTQNRQMAGLLYGSYLKMSFANGNSCFEFKYGQFGTNTVVDLKGNDSIMQMTSGPMGDYVMYHTREDYANLLDGNQVNLEVELMDETKKILGFTCKKAMAENGTSTITYWYTDEIKIDIGKQQFVNPNIPGFPLEFSTIENGMFMRFKLSNYKEIVPKKDITFSIYPGPKYLVTLPKY